MAFSEGVYTPGLLRVGGNIEIDGQQNKLDVAEGNVFAYIRAHDLLFGHSSRRGSPGRALVNNTTQIIEGLNPPRTAKALIINYGRDWEAVKIEGNVQTPSSRNLKQNINPLSSGTALRIVATLEPVSFFYKLDEFKSQCLGFISEDAPPEVASPDRESIVVNHIVAALTRVVKDQQHLIEALVARVTSLENASRTA